MKAVVSASERARRRSLHLFNLFRLLIAGLFAVVGRDLGLGNEAPLLFRVVSFVYLGLTLVLGFRELSVRWGAARVLSLLAVVDVLALSLMMLTSGGYPSGIPVLMMVMLAGVSLVAESRMVLFFAALATLFMLGENLWRLLLRGESIDFLKVGFWCIGFFGVAIIARLLASRAETSAELAEERGEALVQQQALNERIIRDMADGVVVTRRDGHIRHFNPQAAALLGLEAEHKLQGLSLFDLDSGFASLFDGAAQSDEAPRLLRLGAGGRLLRCRVVDSEQHGVRSPEVVIYLTDFEEIQHKLQRDKLAALGRLTASMAHEVRNPLSAVAQAAELLEDEKRLESRTRLLRIIHDNTHRIERLIRDVLALGRREQGFPETVMLEEFIAELIEERIFREPAEAGLYQIEPLNGLSLAIDRAHLHQIVDNLLTNAARHCSRAPGSVRIHAQVLGAGQLALHVHDDGPGLDDTVRQHLFEPFFTTYSKGTGLGLYVARQLAEANDIRLELADSATGADFVLYGRQQA